MLVRPWGRPLSLAGGGWVERGKGMLCDLLGESRNYRCCMMR